MTRECFYQISRFDRYDEWMPAFVLSNRIGQNLYSVHLDTDVANTMWDLILDIETRLDGETQL